MLTLETKCIAVRYYYICMCQQIQRGRKKTCRSDDEESKTWKCSNWSLFTMLKISFSEVNDHNLKVTIRYLRNRTERNKFLFHCEKWIRWGRSSSFSIHKHSTLRFFSGCTLDEPHRHAKIAFVWNLIYFPVNNDKWRVKPIVGTTK